MDNVYTRMIDCFHEHYLHQNKRQNQKVRHADS